MVPALAQGPAPGAPLLSQSALHSGLRCPINQGGRAACEVLAEMPGVEKDDLEVAVDHECTTIENAARQTGDARVKTWFILNAQHASSAR